MSSHYTTIIIKKNTDKLRPPHTLCMYSIIYSSFFSPLPYFPEWLETRKGWKVDGMRNRRFVSHHHPHILYISFYMITLPTSNARWIIWRLYTSFLSFPLFFCPGESEINLMARQKTKWYTMDFLFLDFQWDFSLLHSVYTCLYKTRPCTRH